MTTNPHVWNLDVLFDCAAACPSYAEFRNRFPSAYASAHEQGMLDVIQLHCGWEKAGTRVVATPKSASQPLADILYEDGCLLYEAIDDPQWPVETSTRPHLYFGEKTNFLY